MPIVENIEVNTTFESVIKGGFSLENASIKLNHTGANRATIKGYLSDPVAQLNRKDLLENDVTIELNGDTLFKGGMIKATGDGEGSVTIEAADARVYLNEYTTIVDTDEEGEPVTDIVKQVLTGLNAPFDDSEIEIGLFDTVERVSMSYGISDSKPLYRVLVELAKIQHAFIYVDQENVVRFEPIPPVDYWVPKYVMKPNTGTSAGGKDEVIVKTPFVNSGSNLAKNDFRTKNAAKKRASYDGPTNRTGSVLLNNTVSEKAATNVSVTELVSSELNQESGSFLMPGDTKITPYDTVRLDSDLLVSSDNLTAGEYTVTSVTHTIDATSGYETEVSVTTALDQIYKSIGDSEGISDRQREKFLSARSGPNELLHLTK